MPEVSHPSPTTAEDFRRVLDERAIQPLFQPPINLETRHVVGYEALASGPVGSALESPAALFGAAWRAGRVAELDWPAGRPPSPGRPRPAWARRSPCSSTPSRCRSGPAAPTTSGPPSSWAASACGSSSRSPNGPWPATRPACWPPSPRPARPRASPGHPDLLVEMCMQLEHQGLDAAEANVLLACFQDAGHFTPATRRRYEFLAM